VRGELAARVRPELRERLIERHRDPIRAVGSHGVEGVAVGDDRGLEAAIPGGREPLPLLPGEKTPVQFRVRSVGLGTWWVDDFYVDPKCR